MREVIFETRRLMLPGCSHPHCGRRAIHELRLLGSDAPWTPVCGTHKVWLRRALERAGRIVSEQSASIS